MDLLGQPLRRAGPQSRGLKSRAGSTRRMSQAPDRRQWANRFVRNILLWMVPVSAVWLLAVPIYNPFLTKATENLV